MILGFAGIWLIADEGHITNVAVRPEYFRKGVASTLLRHMLENIKKKRRGAGKHGKFHAVDRKSVV